jgi:hypothetical protein
VLRVVLPGGGARTFQIEAEAVFVQAVARYTNLSELDLSILAG